MAPASVKAGDAFRTIGEVSRDTGVAQHVLRYWETRFPQLRPVTRAGNRRYYRTADVDLVRRIDALLHREGYTIRGVQQLLADRSAATPVDVTGGLRRVRTMLASALDRDGETSPPPR